MRVLVLFLSFSLSLIAGVDVTNKVEILGNPYSRLYKSGGKIYARNIWDMQVFGGKIFIGAGNSNNIGPAPNAGRVPVFSFDPKTNAFTHEYTVAEEQIDRFRVIGDTLYIPGHDATQKWDFGNFYTRTKAGEWTKYRTIPNALHVYDIALHHHTLFAALGLYNISGVGISTSEGELMSVQNLGLSPSRVYSFLKVADVLYACKSFTPKWHRDKYWSQKKKNNYYSIGQYDGLFFEPRYDLDSIRMFPDTYMDYEKSKKIIRSESLNDHAIYLGAYIHDSSHQSIPFGAYIATSLAKNNVNIQRINLPEDYQPWDILVRDKDAYILCYSPINLRVSVLHAKTDALKQWKELFYFKSMSFARSFELLDGDFYFGIGTEVNNYQHWKQSELSPDTGNILRVRR